MKVEVLRTSTLHDLRPRKSQEINALCETIFATRSISRQFETVYEAH